MRVPSLGVVAAVVSVGIAITAWGLRKAREDPVFVGASEVTCNQNSECHPDIVYGMSPGRNERIVLREARYCAKPEGACAASGHCEWVPRIVLDVRDHVCGCDGHTYGNWSAASALGQNVAHHGECAGEALPARKPDPDFDHRRTAHWIHEAEKRATAECYRPGAASVRGRVEITFDAGGRATNVVLSGSLAEAPIAECVRQRFRGVRGEAFQGDPVSVAATVSIPPIATARPSPD